MISLNTVLISAILIEIFTLFVRFVLKINARRFFVVIMKYFGFKKIIRVHHFFIGVLVSIVAFFAQQEIASATPPAGMQCGGAGGGGCGCGG